jgi:hypothetical protein
MKTITNISSFYSKPLFTLVFILLISIKSFAQYSFEVIPDSTQIMIGDHLGILLKLKTDKENSISFPTFSGDTIGKLEIIERKKIDTTFINNFTEYRQRLIVSIFDSGAYPISNIAAVINNTDTQIAEPFTINVNTIAIDTSQPIKAIKAPIDVKLELSDFKYWILAAIMILIAVIGFIIYRKRTNVSLIDSQKRNINLPPHEWATQELKALDAEKLWQKDEHKKYYSRLSDIMRTYLELRYKILALESTTDEIQVLLRTIKIKKELKGNLCEMLTTADFAKFAKLNPLPDQNIRSMDIAIDFIEKTKPVEVKQTEKK